MKKLNLLFFVVFLVSVNRIKAAETEPNNAKATANTLALNGSNTGAINVAGDEDWYETTTNADGKLNVTITVSNGLTLRCYIYDNDGTTLLSSGYSSITTTVSYDGAASGTYFIKLIAFYSGQLPAYTVSNTLTVPSRANDAEPNDTKAQATSLPLNNKKTGHVGYYYNNKRDTADWYKVTTNADGLLKVSAMPANGETIRIYLYDNDGTTLLNSAYSSSNAVLNEDGLATGTYYIKVFSFYDNRFEPYTISDSLFKPEQANDVEPNDSKAQAKNLPLNDSKTGHVGYYCNNKRDTADWYKITTDADGLLRVTAIPSNGETIRIYLYDNNGTTLLNSAYSSAKATLSEGGLAVGTYYVKVFSFYNNQFEPYTLSDSLFTYSYANDGEPNAKPYQAKTVLSTLTETGHVGFYYNNRRDSVDWLKINYTGSGNLDFTINLEPLISGGYNTLRFQVYKDTNASAIHSSYSSAASRTVNLTSLSQGYYWLKIYPFYSSEYVSYSIKNSFTQVAKAKINLVDFDSIASCNNYIKVKPYNGNGPFTVQLFRFGTPYGQAVNVKKGITKKFDNLPAGSYYATAYADGATGNAFGKTPTVILEPVPSNLTTQNITKNNAIFTWSLQSCASYYVVKYRKHGTATWTSKQTVGNVNNYKAINLKANTQYEWVVATADSANGIIVKSEFTDSVLFTTASSALIAQNEINEDDASAAKVLQNALLNVSPNPATSFFIINLKDNKQEKINAMLFNMNGKAVWSSGLINADAINGKKVMVNQYRNGMYYLKIINDKGEFLGVAKLVINK